VITNLENIFLQCKDDDLVGTLFMEVRKLPFFYIFIFSKNTLLASFR